MFPFSFALSTLAVSLFVALASGFAVKRFVARERVAAGDEASAELRVAAPNEPPAGHERAGDASASSSPEAPEWDGAQQDPLTGALNRAAFRRRVSAAIAERPGGVVIFLDLDDFKAVNDTHGHLTGDAVLQTCVRRLTTIGRAETKALLDTGSPDESGEGAFHLTRFGGDEFAAFLDAPIDEDQLARFLRRTLRAVSGDIQIGNRTVSISASLGAAICPAHGEDFDALMMAADAAMYAAKAKGKNRFEVYSARLDAKARDEAREENEVTKALSERQLEFVYQPIFDLRTFKIVSAEALVRWKHPESGLLPPGEFFDALNRARLAKPFSEWCINEIIRTIAELDSRGAPIMIAANVSPEQLASLEFISLIKSSLAYWKCPAHLLQIEVTEDAAMRDPELTIASLNKLHELGVSLVIDDFGVGYSNLVSLTRLPISRLKLDRSLLLAVDEQPAAFVLMQTVINLANSLGFHSVVEGVETDAQLEMVQSMGADFAQGFLLSRPVNLEQLVALKAASDIVSGAQGSDLRPRGVEGAVQEGASKI